MANRKDTIEALKMVFEKTDEAMEKERPDQERRFIKDATEAYISDMKNVTGIQIYTPEEILKFLDQPTEVVQKRMGGEWAKMDPENFDTFLFTMKKKIRKSDSLVDWSNE